MAAICAFSIIYMEESHDVTGTATGRQYGRSFAQGREKKTSIPRAFETHTLPIHYSDPILRGELTAIEKNIMIYGLIQSHI